MLINIQRRWLPKPRFKQTTIRTPLLCLNAFALSLVFFHIKTLFVVVDKLVSSIGGQAPSRASLSIYGAGPDKA